MTLVEPIIKDVVYFGRINFRGKDKLFGIKREDRRQHTYVIGKTGTGKTSLIHNMIVQDIANGEGVCVVDPHGELVESLIHKIPEERLDDVIYFNPADSDFHIGFNVLELPDPKYKHLVASGLMGIFTKIWANVWSARMEYILNNAILALLDTPGSTLLGIPRILVDKTYRQKIIANLKDPVVKSFWINEYEEWRDQFRNEAIAPIQNKVGQFLSTALVRNIVGQSKSTIDVFDIMNSGKIFLVNVSKGRIGEDNSMLLGGMLITKLQLSAMERVRVPEEERVDFFLYVDEFQNFATDSFANILSEARKYRLNLTLAHQYIGQLVTDVSTKVRDAVFGNVGTMIMFRVGASDAEFLESEFEPEFVIQDMVNLPNRCIYLKLMVNGITSRPFSANTIAPFKVPSSENIHEQIVESSRTRYARPRSVVEKEINEWSGVMDEAHTSSGAGEGGKFKAVCSSCSKETSVPFEPQPGRPVYCLDCLNKIKAGELAPVRTEGLSRLSATASRTASRGFSDLAKLGIEFGGDEGKPAGRPFDKTSLDGTRDRQNKEERPQKAPEGSPPRRPGPFRGPPSRDQSPSLRRGEGPPRRFEERPSHPPSPPRRQSILHDDDERRVVSPEEQKEHELRLNELQPAEEKQKKYSKEGEEPNIGDLRDSLRKALGKLEE